MSEPNTVPPALPAILFIDDEVTSVKYFQRAIGTLAPVMTGASVAEGKALLDAHADSLAVLVSDQRMPGEHGNELLRYARERYPHVVRILTTAYSEIEQTVEAVNMGEIHRYIRKPWDITALRMELRQALELASLRKERDQLLGEKLSVLQKQTVATRIAQVRALAGSLVGPEHFQPVETYLYSVAQTGMRASEPDWLRVDYGDLMALEGHRSGAMGYDVASRLAGLRAHGTTASRALELIAQTLRDSQAGVRLQDNALVWDDPAMLTEFLAQPAQQPVSAMHATWLACLLWLDECDGALAVAREGDSIVHRAVPRESAFASDRLAVWVEQFA